MALHGPKSQPRPILKQPNSTSEEKKRASIFTLYDDSDDLEQDSHASVATSMLMHTDYHNDNNYESKYAKKNSDPFLNVLHGHHKITKDLVEIVFTSTKGFLKHIEEDLNGIYNTNYNTSEPRHKEEFIKQLKEFLTCETCSDIIGSNSKIAQINQINRKMNKDIVNFMRKNDMAFSDPDFIKSNMQNRKAKQLIKNQNLSLSKIQVLKKNFFISKVLKNEQYDMSCSLPASDGANQLLNNLNKKNTNSIFDSIYKEFDDMDNHDLLYEIYQSQIKDNSNLAFADHNRVNSNDNDENDSNDSDALIEANKKTKKIVRFADSLGLDLENVRVIASLSNSSSFSDLYSFEYFKTNKPSQHSLRAHDEDMGSKIKTKTLILIPNFSLQPDLDFESLCKLSDYSFDSDNKILKLLVRVRNISYEKHVFVRFTFNHWKTSNDIETIFTKITNLKSSFCSNFSDSIEINPMHDFFMATIFVPDCEQHQMYNEEENDHLFEMCGYNSSSGSSSIKNCSRSNYASNYLSIEFAIYYNANSNTYWDNNFGNNYSFQCINENL